MADDTTIEDAAGGEGAAAEATTEGSERMPTYTYVCLGAQPPERSTLQVALPNGEVRQVQSGSKVQLTVAQHDHFVREHQVFQEDIVSTPGG